MCLYHGTFRFLRHVHERNGFVRGAKGNQSRLQRASHSWSFGWRNRSFHRQVPARRQRSVPFANRDPLSGNPADLTLIRMQSDGLKPIAARANYTSVVDALVRISRTEGITALWAGCFPTVVRAMALNFGQLAFFSEAKTRLKDTWLSPRLQTLSASAIAGFFASFFSLPFDFVKTRLQKQTKAPDGTLPYKGMFDCFQKVAKDEGIFRFYRGFSTYYVRIAPHAMITLIVADYLGYFALFSKQYLAEY